jgi:hypothetical protein
VLAEEGLEIGRAVVACSEVQLVSTRNVLGSIAAMPGLSGRPSICGARSSRDIRWGDMQVWSRPPSFFHDPQRGLKFVNAKREFQPN